MRHFHSIIYIPIGIVLFILICLVAQISESHLGNGYSFDDNIKVILDAQDNIIVPEEVRDLGRNRQYIVAGQYPYMRPGFPCTRSEDPLYWIIDKNSNNVIGPLSETEYQQYSGRWKLPKIKHLFRSL